MNCNHRDQGYVVTMKSPPEEKIRLMSAMFYGRRDVFARRYERKDGRSGYAPVCSNEWVRGVCGKCAKVRGDLLQENGYFILRFLADDVMNNLGEVMTRVVRRLK